LLKFLVSNNAKSKQPKKFENYILEGMRPIKQ